MRPLVAAPQQWSRSHSSAPDGLSFLGAATVGEDVEAGLDSEEDIDAVLDSVLGEVFKGEEFAAVAEQSIPEIPAEIEVCQHVPS
jgi:hypothetical protein